MSTGDIIALMHARQEVEHLKDNLQDMIPLTNGLRRQIERYEAALERIARQVCITPNAPCHCDEAVGIASAALARPTGER